MLNVSQQRAHKKNKIKKIHGKFIFLISDSGSTEQQVLHIEHRPKDSSAAKQRSIFREDMFI